MEGIKAILFDLDGTVLDTYELIITCFRKAADDLLPEGTSDRMFANTIGIPLPQQMAMYAPDDPELAAELTRVYRVYNAEIWRDYTRTFPEVPAMLEALKQAGLTMAVVTSKRVEPAVTGLQHCGLYEYFDLVVGGDQGYAAKPAPDSLLACMEQLGLTPNECIYVGDSPYDIQAGHAAGSKAIGAAWGIYPVEDLNAQHPEFLCMTAKELADVVLG